MPDNHSNGHDHNDHPPRGGEHGRPPVCCFVEDTFLLAGDGSIVPVGDIEIGDELMCEINGALIMRQKDKVRWVGIYHVPPNADPLTHAPILIKANAFGHIPREDVRLSPDHAVLIGTILIHAGAMVNGTTIVREELPDNLRYYHVEMESGHTCLFAHDMPVESFVDNVDRQAFTNWDVRLAPSEPVIEMQHPRAKSQRQIPVTIRLALKLPVDGRDLWNKHNGMEASAIHIDEVGYGNSNVAHFTMEPAIEDSVIISHDLAAKMGTTKIFRETIIIEDGPLNENYT